MLTRKKDGKKVKMRPLSKASRAREAWLAKAARGEKKPMVLSSEHAAAVNRDDAANIPYRAVNAGTQGSTPTPLPGAEGVEVVLVGGDVVRVQRHLTRVQIRCATGALVIRPLADDVLEIAVEHP